MHVFGYRIVARLKAAVRAFQSPTLVQQAVYQQHQSEFRVVLGEELLSGKNALITGVGKNIGKSIAMELAAHGANVYGTCLEEKTRSHLEKNVSPMFPGKIRWFQSDLTRESDNEALFAFFRDSKVKIDIYVSNSVSHTDEMDQSFKVNFFGPVDVARRVARGMVSEGTRGSIVFITSIHQDRIRGILSYSSSKAALKMAIEELAVELAPYNIRVNGIAPGYVREDSDGNPLPHRKVPLAGTSITPRYIGRAAVYLSSDHFSKYTTGSILRIDGGLSLFNHMFLESPKTRRSAKKSALE